MKESEKDPAKQAIGNGSASATPAVSVPFWQRLDTRLSLALILAGLIPVLLFAGYTIVTLSDVLDRTSRSIISATTRDYVDRADTWVQRGIDQVGLAARLPHLAEIVMPESSSGSIENAIANDLDSLRDYAPVFIRSVALFDLDGRLIMASPEPLKRFRGGEQMWFREPLLTSEPGFHVAFDEPEFGQLVFSAPLLVRQEPVGVIRIGYHLTALQHLLSQLTTVAAEASFVAIVAENGTLLASDLPPGIITSADWRPGWPVPVRKIREVLPGNRMETLIEIAYPYMGIDQWTACLQPLETNPWSIVYFLPSEQYLAPVRQRITVALLIAGGLILLILAISLASARVFSRDLRDLAAATQTLGTGDLDIRVPEKSRDECGLLARSFNYMARQLANRTAALEEAREQAEAASRAKSEFLSVVSHEVRTPLNSVIGYSDLLIDQTDIPEEHRSSIRLIKRSGHQLLQMLNNMLDFTKLEAGKVEVEAAPFAVLDLFSDVIEQAGAEVTRKNLELFLEPVGEVPVTLVADGPKLRQILLNLLFNSLKFTDEGGIRIYFEVDFKPERKTGDFMVLVEDTGIGISPEVRKRLFQPFSQGDSSVTRRFGGTGLGLAISRHIAHACQGELTECSPAEGGASFALSVPVTRKGTENLPPARLDPGHKGKTVLLVSSNFLSIDFLEDHLGRAGLHCLREPADAPDAVVVDEPARHLHDMRERLRQMGTRLTGIPVLLLHHGANPELGAVIRGPHAALGKPVLPQELLSQVNALLSDRNAV